MVGRMDVTGSLPGNGPKVDTAARPVLQDDRRIVDLFTAAFAPRPTEFALRDGTPGTVAGWKALADGLLPDQSCVFHRNLEISAYYAWMYKLLPDCFKWAGMAAFASYHVRLALLPFRLDTDRTGYVDIPQSLERHRPHPGGLLAEDVDTVRTTNNAIFDDIFWVHLAYSSAPDGIERLRALLSADHRHAVMLAGFEAIDRGRRVLEDRAASSEARRTAEDLIWEGNVRLLEHEQRAVVQPNFDRLSRAYSGLFSLGSTLDFEVRGLRREVSYFTSFYLYAVTRGLPRNARAGTWPRITRFDDRWPWIVNSIVPRFRKFDADARLVETSLRRIVAEAQAYTSHACVLPPSPQADALAPIPETRMPSAVIEADLLDGPEG
jgi:hypothetical protein